MSGSAQTMLELADLTDEKMAGWARNWHWQDTAEDRPVDPSIYFRDMRMLRAFVAALRASPSPHAEMREALEQIDQMPFSMVNDSESLRHTIRTMQKIAHEALSSASASRAPDTKED